jgi:hypothetical protein
MKKGLVHKYIPPRGPCILCIKLIHTKSTTYIHTYMGMNLLAYNGPSDPKKGVVKLVQLYIKLYFINY